MSINVLFVVRSELNMACQAVYDEYVCHYSPILNTQSAWWNSMGLCKQSENLQDLTPPGQLRSCKTQALSTRLLHRQWELQTEKKEVCHIPRSRLASQECAIFIETSYVSISSRHISKWYAEGNLSYYCNPSSIACSFHMSPETTS